jgi:ribonucleoside-diphosphate reductase alpha chain
MKFRGEDGELDLAAFQRCRRRLPRAGDRRRVLVTHAGDQANAKAFRELGLGYANLGALLMARGLPYDSDEGRAYAAAITALMTGRLPEVGGDRG